MNDLKRPGTYLDLPAHIDRLDTSYTYTSRLYPILVNEDEVTSSLRVRELKFPLVRVAPDSLNVGSEMTGIEMKSILINALMPTDSLDVGSEMTGIELVSMGPTEVNALMPSDALDVGSEMTGIELREILLENTMKPESLDVGSEMTGIKLESQI